MPAPANNLAQKQSPSEQHFNRLSPLQIFYYWHLLTLKQPKWESSPTSQALLEAKVEPIPHQVEAAMFAFRNPLAGGVILADEVGLGKTIETGLILSQLWAEGKRSFLIIAPKSLRHQWQDELFNLFYLQSTVLDNQSFKKVLASGEANPFSSKEKILIINEHFAERHSNLVQTVKWDYVVIDEAHRLRNVWKPAKNEAKRAKKIRSALQPFKKLLLTATPLQNNLMELFGLVSFIDPHVLGTAESFARTFASIPEEMREDRLLELRERMRLFFKRELRKNVSEFIQFTERRPITITFSPTEDEEKLRVGFEEYLRRERTSAIPASASALLRLVYFKLLASSTFALKRSLLNLFVRLVHIAALRNDKDLFDKLLSEIRTKLTLSEGQASQDLIHFEQLTFKRVPKNTFESLREHLQREAPELDLPVEEPELAETFSDDQMEELAADQKASRVVTATKDEIAAEGKTILEFIMLGRSIVENTKGKALVATLRKQFEKAKTESWPEKAVIFTEFRSTQDYVITALEQAGINIQDDVVVFNGSAGDAASRRELVEDFKTKKKIFLTTEAGAEGLNLQFCNLLINYDLPWNPQRIEQRIGRCHRYGQKLDVVVINFVNDKNIADRRILELLDQKFRLFQGAFGVSDEVLGEIESGVDIEREIFKIYLSCRSEAEIKESFERILSASVERREARIVETKNSILNSFDEEVQRKLKVFHGEVQTSLDKKQIIVRDIVLSSLPYEDFQYDGEHLEIVRPMIGLEPTSRYTFSKLLQTGAELLHINHPLISKLLPDPGQFGEIRFHLTTNHSVTLLEEHAHKRGYAFLFRVKCLGIEEKEMLIPIVLLDNLGDPEEMSQELASRLFEITSDVTTTAPNIPPGLSDLAAKKVRLLTDSLQTEMGNYNSALYEEESQKIEYFFQDIQEQKRLEIRELENSLADLKKERAKLPLAAAQRINTEIQHLKDKIIRIEESIADARRSGRDQEKKLLDDLNTRATSRVEITNLLSVSIVID